MAGDGMSATCVDNPRLGLVGCGATYGGEVQHSVARVPWSTSPDGMAHITGRLSTIDKCWAFGKDGVLTDPINVSGLQLDARNVWRQEMSEQRRASLVTA
jgi:hypothetical protein